MGDMGEMYNENKKCIKIKKQVLMNERMQFVKDNEFDYEEKANGHLRIFAGTKKFDVWLTTAKWTEVGTNVYNNGWNQLMKVVKRNMVD